MLALSACAHQNVEFAPRILAGPATQVAGGPAAPVVEIFLNRLGSVYPATVDEGPDVATADWLEVQRQSVVRAGGHAAWESLQSGRIADKADAVAARLNAGSDGPQSRVLLVMIHGFRESAEDTDGHYRAIRARVERYLGERGGPALQPVYLSVYWDGLDSRFPAKSVWGKAQHNGPLVGFRLRELFREIELRVPGLPVRVIAHSSGAFVIASTVGNPRHALPRLHHPDQSLQCGCDYRAFCENAANLPGTRYGVPASKDFRVLMLAPATSALSFAPAVYGPEARPPLQDLSVDGVLMRELTLIVGMNPLDYGTNKGVGFAKPGGSTALGRYSKRYCNYLVPGLRKLQSHAQRPRSVDSYLFNFSRSSKNRSGWLFWEDHAVQAYLGRDDMTPALAMLFGDSERDESWKYCN